MPLVQKKVSDLMVPLAEYPVVRTDHPLRKAVARLSKEYFEPTSEVRHRTILVVDENQRLVGILDFRTILQTLIPWGLWGLLAERSELGAAVALAEAGFEDLGVSREDFNQRVLNEADVPVKDIMLKIRGSIQADDDLLKALRTKIKKKLTVLPVYAGERLVGVIRDVDLFLQLAEIMKDKD